MEKLLQFFRALECARKCGCALSCDYSYDNFASTEWDWWTLIPGKTDFCVSPAGIFINDAFYSWTICSSFRICPVLGKNRLGLAITTF